MSSFSLKFPTIRVPSVTSETALTIRKLINGRKEEDSVQQFSFYKMGVKISSMDIKKCQLKPT